MALQLPPIFSPYVKNLLEKDFSQFASPLKDHPQIPFILDTLSRYQQHHIMLTALDSEPLNQAFLEGIAHHIATETAPNALKGSSFIFFDVIQLLLNPLSDEQIEQIFHLFTTEIHSAHKNIILAFNHAEILFIQETNPAINCLKKLIISLLMNNQWRFIFFINPYAYQKNKENFLGITQLFSMISLNELTQNDSLNLLIKFKPVLEDFHQVIISDETFASAYAMASHYLAGASNYDKAMQLLDSAAARVSAAAPQEHKGIVTSHLLAQLISSWTHIPLTHLQQNRFQANKLIEGVRKYIFGQYASLEAIGLLLQNACLKLDERPGPLCTFLFAGPADSGKTATAYAIAEHLFGHKKALLRVNLSKTHYTSLAEIRVVPKTDNEHAVSLLEAVQQIPYAIILIENIDQIPAATFDLFKDIFTRGIIYDEQGNKYDFHHCIIIMTTRLGSEQINQLSTIKNHPEAAKPVDLMQLVLNVSPAETITTEQHTLSIQELRDEIMPSLQTQFTSTFIQQLYVIPFIPLNYAALEQIIKQKLKFLAKQIELKFGIELSYAAEVIKFLAHETFWHKPTKSLDQLLQQYLYGPVAHEILAHAENKNQAKRLLLQLNDSGQLLRCEVMTASEVGLYNL